MSSHWLALHAQLVRSVNRPSAITTISALTSATYRPDGFRDPSHLLDWLHRPGGNPDARNQVLKCVLFQAVGRNRISTLAKELLILALWPGLCTIRRRLKGYVTADQLDADLLSGLSIGIGNADPGKINRVAATLLRNLERDLRREYSHQSAPGAIGTEKIEAIAAADHDDPPGTIIAAARRLLGDDGALLTAVHIAGFSQREAAEVIGISHDATRKRCQRAMARLRALSIH